MSTVTFHNNVVNLSGSLPVVGSTAPNFSLVSGSLDKVTLDAYAGKKKLLNIVPSFDTPVCAKSAKFFEGLHDKVVVIGISRDTPFAQGRFCTSSGIEHTSMLADVDHTFGDVYGVEILDGPLQKFLARAVVVLDEDNKVLYTELVSEITNDPNYEEAVKFLQ